MREVQRGTILVVDDNDATRYATVRVLSSAGFTVVEATTGTECLKLVRTCNPDLVTLDVRLPDILGFEVCRRIKADPATKMVPVLHISASYMDDEHKVRGLETGADGYLTHPVEPTVLLATVRALLRVRRTEDELRELNATLEQRVSERTAEAEERAAQIRMLASDLTQAERRERRRLAQLLHDHVQQLLVAAKMQLSILHQRLQHDANSELAERVERLLDRAISDSRSLNTQLSPRVLFDAGLKPALEWLADEMLDRYGLTVSVDVAEDANPSSEEVRILAFEATRELLFNVVKHAGVAEAAVRVRQGEQGLRVEVEDRGKGFDRAVDASGVSSGSGLLGIRQRLELIGGEFDLVQPESGGTRVCLSLPLLDEAPLEATAPRERMNDARHKAAREDTRKVEPPPLGGRIRLLLVDDHQVVREGMASLLETRSEIEIVGEASDGVEAIEVAQATQPDVVLMDVSMPRMGGVEATRRICELLPSTRVVGVSMHGDPDVVNAMRAAGASDFVAKGSPAQLLVSAIHAAARA